MNKTIFIMTLILGLGLGLSIMTIISQTALAQTQNNTQTPLPQTTVIAQLIEQRDILFVTVLFESPSTLILDGKSNPITGGYAGLGQAVDIAKQKGYSIDSVTVFTEESKPMLGTITLTPIYTIFMSK